MSTHFSDDYVWLVVSSPSSFTIPFDKVKSYGITGLYYDRSVTLAQLNQARQNMPKVGVFETANPSDDPATVAKHINDDRLRLCAGDNGQTAFLLDVEPSDAAWWQAFLPAYRALMPGRVTDFTPEPFKASVLPVQDLLNARMNVRVQAYYGDMSPVDAYEAGIEWVNAGYPADQVRMFFDGGRVNKPPIFYQGNVVRKLMGGTCIWSANLMREAGLI